MAYKSFVNCTKEEYKNVIYSQDAKNKIQILFNGVELEDADYFCESFTLNSRIIPNGSKVFGLNSFVANEAELILHDVDVNTIVDDVRISIGTLVNNTYEYVPIGIFHIQDKPVTDKNKVTVKLRDSSVKFDFNYNAEPLITNNGGSATKFQIFQDICTQAGVTTQIASFLGSEDVVSVYDNSKTARQYIAWLAEQSGAIATISRDDELVFIYLNELEEIDVPLYYVEKYENGEPYKIERIVYEDAIRKFESPDPTLETMAEEEEQSQEKKGTLYLDTANPYISSQEQVDSIFEEVGEFEINSFNTGRVLGNPTIDSYDLIKITELLESNIIEWDGDATGREIYNFQGLSFYKVSDLTPTKKDLIGQTAEAIINGGVSSKIISETDINKWEAYPNIIDVSMFMHVLPEPMEIEGVNCLAGIYFFSLDGFGYATKLTLDKKNTYKTLATNTLTYTGVLRQEFDTKIGLEARQENVTKTGEQLYRQYVQTEINNLDQSIKQTILKQDEQGTALNETIATLEKTTQTIQDMTGNISKIEQNVNSIDGSVKKIGGNNMVINSVGYYGADKYTVNGTGTILWGKNGIFNGVSDSEAGIIITNDKIVHDSIGGLVIGKEYTLTFKYFNDANNNLIFTFYNSDESVEILNISEQKSLSEIVYTFIANDTTCHYSIESISLENTTCGITDLIIKGGNTRSDWESAPAEIQGTNITIYYNGIEITSVTDEVKTVIDNIGFSITNTNEDIMVTVNKDRVLLNNTRVNGYFQFNSFLWQEITINDDIHLLIT